MQNSIHVSTVSSFLGARGRRHAIEPWRGASMRELAEAHARPEWGSQGLRVVRNGRLADWQDIAAPGDSVLIGPDIGIDIGTIALLVIGIASATYSYFAAQRAISKLRDAPERSDPTYAWDATISTSYGAGFRRPVLLGELRVGGQVINSQVAALPGVRGSHLLLLDIAISDSRIHSIGGLQGTRGEADILTKSRQLSAFGETPQFPSGLKINGTQRNGTSEVISFRLGSPTQSPIAHQAGATSLQAVRQTLREHDDAITVPVQQPQASLAILEMRLPQGLYVASPWSGARVEFRVQARQVGGPWQVSDLWVIDTTGAPVDFGFSEFRVVPLYQISAGGPYEIEVRKTFPTSRQQTLVDAAVVESVAVVATTFLSYPGLAHYTIGMLADENNSGTQPNVSIPAKGLVRAWISETDGWTDYGWDATGPWVFPIGNNPAWCAVEFLLGRWGAGRVTSEDDLELDEWRDFADFCDQPHPWDASEPLLRWDGLISEGLGAWETLEMICRAGRAAPYRRDGKIGVKFEYASGFSRGSGSQANTVPDRTIVDVLTTSNLLEFELLKTDPHTVPTAFSMDILDRDLDWERAPVLVEDPEARPYEALVDRDVSPLRREPLDMRGVTRRIQATYEGRILHNFNRLSRTAARVKAAIDAVALQVGDLVVLQHDAFRPRRSGTYDPTLDPSPLGTETYAARSVLGGTGTNLLAVDQDVTIVGAPRSGTRVLLMDEDGELLDLTIDEAPGVYPAGYPLALWDWVGGSSPSVNIRVGEPVAFGEFDAVRRTYVVSKATVIPEERAIALELDEWSDEMFVVSGSLDFGENWRRWGKDGAEDDLEARPLAPREPVPPTPPTPADVSPTATLAAGDTSAALQWHMASDKGVGRLARAWMRASDSQPWTYLGESDRGILAHRILPRGQTVEIALAPVSATGQFVGPDSVDPALVEIPEFAGVPLDAIRGFRARQDDDGLLLRWDPVDGADEYEIRAGAAWNGGIVLLRTPATSARVRDLHFPGALDLSISARRYGGHWSSAPRSATASAWAFPVAELALVDELSGTPAGSHDDTLWSASDGWIELAPTAIDGSYEAVAVDLGEDLDVEWVVWAESYAHDPGPIIDDATWIMGGSEGDWRRLDWREPSETDPGADFSTALDDDETAIDANDAVMALRSPGEHARIDLECRYHQGGAWSGWESYAPSRRIARQMQVRVRLRRSDLRRDVRLVALKMAAGL